MKLIEKQIFLVKKLEIQTIVFMFILALSSERIFIPMRYTGVLLLGHLTYDDSARQFQNFFCSIYVILTFSLRSLVTNNSRLNSIHYSQERSDQVMCRCTIMHTYILHDCMGSILQGGTISSFDTSSL